MSAPCGTAERAIYIVMSDDAMCAYLHGPDLASLKALSAADVRRLVSECGMEPAEVRIHGICNAIAALEALDSESPLVIAEGRPAVPPRDETIEWDTALAPIERDWRSDDPINHYTFNSVLCVDEGDRIGRILASEPGNEGTDLKGKILEMKQTPRLIELNAHIQRQKDGTLIAQIPGRLVFEDRRLEIRDVLAIPHDVDFESGNLNSPVDVTIGGTVRDRFEVRSRKSITIGGAVEAAIIEAAGNVTIKGGIIQRGRGSVVAGGDIIAKFCEDANLCAAGDIRINSEVMNSMVDCRGALLVPTGAIMGGRIYARNGLHASEIGSEGSVATWIAVGIHPEALRKAASIRDAVRAKRERIDQLRQVIQPMLANLQRLPAGQRERVTELSAQADLAEAEVVSVEAKRAALLEDASPETPAYVMVSRAIHHDTEIRIGPRVTRIHHLLHGPVKIVESCIRGVTELVAKNQQTGSARILPSYECLDAQYVQGPTLR